MAKLDTLRLCVSNPEAQKQFYCNILGMSDLGNGKVGYSPQQAALQFVPAERPYQATGSDSYWKIAISVANIELAYAQLKAQGVTVSKPAQFRDVGFLAKITDPEGFTVELIDHWFAGQRPHSPLNNNLLGGGPHLSLVTFRSADIASLEPQILAMGLTPLSIQPVKPYGFTLYFYAFTDEMPPSADLHAIENRTWVYQRPYSVLEIQHIHQLDKTTDKKEGYGGYESLTVSADQRYQSISSLNINPIISIA